ncbi:hypothetical protein ACOQFV_27280 [Nocardiopsis changdeensis]|uniref:DUF3618 domain-containing protein n=1 Tax=Nocardiopsis changdeensis TaxID=2831969 RepID=A0ABX8BQ75_9ACTN|nr:MULTISPECIES: hypothetical protein [Nocardiopsis]QUX22971.1 hypothetical protein KGD84_00740 [Nocardiopsis changdeensis]QYX38914.1 hypothetical protein K1J57_10190 [Nocardiopsis sp. MT53]
MGELLTLMREEMRKGFDDLRREIGGRVSSDVYEADKRLTEERIARLGSEVAELRADAKQKEATEEAAEKAAEDRRAADRRMVRAAVITAGFSLLVGAVLLALQLLAT